MTEESIKGRTVRFIRKSNNLVEGKYRFDIWEMRIFAKMLTMIQPADEDFKRYRIWLKDIISDFGIEKNNRSYEELKRGAEKLASREIRLPVLSEDGKEMELFTHIASGVKSFADNRQGKYIEIDFHPDMKPYLLQLQTKFLMYDARNVLKLPSSFSIRIYELLKQYETIGKRKMSVEELKEMLDIQEKYSLYANLKQRVILKAQSDLANFTDIKFSFEEVKRGKSVTNLIFFIFKNEEIIGERGEQAKELRLDYQITEQDVAADEIFKALKQYKGVSKLTVENWLKQYSLELIVKRINFVKNQIEIGKDIKNPIGLIYKLLQEPDLFDSIQEQKDKNAKMQESERLAQKIKTAQQKNERELLHQEQADKLKNIAKLVRQNPALPQQFLKDLQQQRLSENTPFIVQLAYDNYVTDIEGIEPASYEEMMYNYHLGGSFSALMLDWFEEKLS